MKTRFLKLMLLAICLMASHDVFAEDFKVGGIYYKYVDKSAKTVAVSYRGDKFNSYSDEYTGSVSIPCAGGGSVSSETGWDGRKKDEEDENFRLRCWLHAAKSVKNSRKVQTKRKGYRA